MGDEADVSSKLRSTAHLRPFVVGQGIMDSDLNGLLEAMRHLDRRVTGLEARNGIDVRPLAPPFDPNENPLPLPGGDFEDRTAD
jgi:hypothetical protein